MNRLLIAFCLVCFGTVAVAGDVLVVKGTSSLPNDGERRYCESIVRGLGRYLDDLGVDWDTTTDEEAKAGLLGRYPVVIMPYNTVISKGELSELRSYVGGGGKLIVFYSADDALAAFMGFRLGKYIADEVPNRWCAVRFTADAPKGMPDVFYQESRNIRPVYPIGPPAKVFAYWENSRGERTQYPAIVSGPKGIWMSHVLRSDMDEEGQKQMLLEVIATYAPGIEKKAAAKYLERVEKPGSFASFREFVEAITSDKTKTTVKYLSDRFEKVNKLFADGSYRKCISSAIEMRREMESVYAKARLTAGSGRVGVWDHSGRGLYVGDWARTCGVLKEAGVTDVYCNLLWPWTAHFKSSVVGESKIFSALGDQASASIEAAHKAGMKLHLWKVCWTMEGAPPALVEVAREQGRLQVDKAGKTVNWLCPSNPENLRREKDTLREALKNYAFDGVHLDYIRYKDASVCFCPSCKHEFEKWHGSSVANWPAGVQQGEVGIKYTQWRVKQISDFVRDVDTLTAKIRPQAEVSVAVFGKYPSCVPSVAQDWVSWVKEGYVDYVCPMNYTEDLTTFRGYVDSQIGLVGDPARVMPGIGVTARESRLDAFQVVDQIRLTQARKTAGYILFDLNRSLEKGVLKLQ